MKRGARVTNHKSRFTNHGGANHQSQVTNHQSLKRGRPRVRQGDANPGPGG